MDSPDPFAELDLDDPTDAPTAGDVPQPGTPQLSVLDSFARGDRPAPAEARSSASAADPHVQIVDPALVRQESSQASAAAGLAWPKTRRGRKPGSTKHQADLARLLGSGEAAPAALPVPSTRQERASAAGKASARKRQEARAADQAQPARPHGSSASSVNPCLALVPVVQDAASQRPHAVLFEQ